MATVTNLYTVQFNPSLDGYVGRAGVDQTLANIRAGAGTTSTFVGTGGDIQLYASTTSNQFEDLYRQITLFDTSSIPASATITSATITIVTTGAGNGIGSPSVEVVSSNPASTSAIANSDYSNLGSTSFASISYASIVVGNDITASLNASGLANITKAGISKFGFVTSWDLNNSFTGVWSSLNGSFVLWNSGVASVLKPILTVSYSVDFPTLSVDKISSLANVTTITTS